MAINTTIFNLSSCKWAELVFIESAASPAILATETSSRIDILKDITFCISIWLGDSLVIYRAHIIWSGNARILAIPALLFIGSIVSGIGLTVASAAKGAHIGAKPIIAFGIAFYSLSVGLNVIVTLLISGRLLYHQHNIRRISASCSQEYTSLIAIIVESGALYAVAGLVYIPLWAVNSPIQYPFSPLLAASSAVAPNLIVLRIALGKAVTKETLSTHVTQNIQFARPKPHQRTLSLEFHGASTIGSRTLAQDTSVTKSINSLGTPKGNDPEEYPLEAYPPLKINGNDV